jgi:hypothetical protein
MNSETGVISSIIKGPFQMRSLLMVIVAGLAFHVHAVRIMNGSPLAHPELWPQCAQNPVVFVCALATVVATISIGAVASTLLWQSWPFHNLNQSRELEDYVPLHWARRCALLERDTLWIERIEKEEAEQWRSRRYKERNDWLFFAWLVLLIVDLRGPESAAALLAQAAGFKELSSLLWVLCVVVGAAWFHCVLWQDPMLGLIEHPELSAKRRAEFRASAIAAQAIRQAVPATAYTQPRSSRPRPAADTFAGEFSNGAEFTVGADPILVLHHPPVAAASASPDSSAQRWVTVRSNGRG